MGENVTKIEIFLDNGRKITFLPRYSSQGEDDVEFLFNGPDSVEVALNMGVMIKDKESDIVEKDRRKATLSLECLIATDRITID